MCGVRHLSCLSPIKDIMCSFMTILANMSGCILLVTVLTSSLFLNNFRSSVEKFFGRPIKTFRADWSGEYQGLSGYLAQHGILEQTSCPHTPEQNGCAERKHRHITETGRTLLHHAAVPLEYWTYAFQTAAYLINRLPASPIAFDTPFHKLFSADPDYTHLRIFGCLCFPWLKPYARHKLDAKSAPSVFLGYSLQHKGYYCLNLYTKKVQISRHVIFDETVFPFQVPNSIPRTPSPDESGLFPRPNLPLPLPIIQAGPLAHSPPTQHQPAHDSSPTPPAASPHLGPTSPGPLTSPNDTTPPPALSSSSTDPFQPNQPAISTQPAGPPPATRPPTHTHPMVTRAQTGKLKPKSYSTQTHDSTPEPTCFTVAHKQPEWRQAMQDEFNALLHNKTWTLVPHPSHGKRIVGNKWVYRIKRHPDGTIARYKARLVAKGYHQTEGIDYTETFSPVIKPASVCLILSIALSQGWPIKQLDVSNAFLHGDLQETIGAETRLTDGQQQVTSST
ncbi:Retrovirus-related Pol polyprotein from transposon TNT 1-94 [Linum perenne]